MARYFAFACLLVFALVPQDVIADDKKILHRGNNAEPRTLDPHRAEGVPARNIQRDLFEGLTTRAPDARVLPGSAQSWEISEDGRTYTFLIRETARWSNGDPLTARDFAFSFRRAVNPETGSPVGVIYAPIQNAQSIVRGEMPPSALGVQALSDRVLQIRLESPTPYFLDLLTHPSTFPVHAASLAMHGNEFIRPGKLVSNGAYRLVEWQLQSHMKLERNPYYHDNANTSIDEVWFYPVEDQVAELNRYRAGELDMTYGVPVNRMQWIKKHLGDQLYIAPWLGVYYFGFNLTREPFKDNPALRKALFYAIDRNVLVSRITGAGEVPAYNWVPPIQGYAQQLPPQTKRDFHEQAELARKYYAEAGYSRANPLKTTIHYNTRDLDKRVSTAVAAMWKQTLGVETELVNQEFKVFLQTRQQKTATQVFRAGWIGDYNDPNAFLELLHSRHGVNDSGYDNPDFDALLKRASRETNPWERMLILQQAEAMMLEDLPVIPLYFYVKARLVKPTVVGYRSNIMDHLYTRYLDKRPR